MRPVFGYNFNTMRPEILAALLGLDEQGIRGVLDEREKRQISRLTTIALLSGIHLDIDEMGAAYPSLALSEDIRLARERRLAHPSPASL